MTLFQIFNAIGCTLTVIAFVVIWAAAMRKTQTVGRPEDDPGDRLTEL